jgi:cytochrome c oxidase subunit 2
MIGFLSTAGAGEPSFWLPSQSSTIAQRVDSIWEFILWLSVFFFALVVVLGARFALKYRGSRGQGAQSSTDHNTLLEIVWTVIPTLLVVILFWIGFRTYIDMSTPPENAYEIQVTGQKWQWLFTYPNGYVDENLHAPVNTDVVLVMTSEDVIHSMFIPAFRTKQDVVPGRYSKLWFNATETGDFDIYCAEYCGTSHSDMGARAIIHPPGEYESWLADASDLHGRFPPVEIGETYYKRFGCKQCHSLDGTPGIGPTFQGLYGTMERLTDGSSILVDENYIRESILNPQAKVTEGYNPVMPTYQGRFNDQDITAIIEFIKSVE